MIFLKLFYVFSKIGIFNFGGGYAMLSLIYSETVVKNHWLSNAEFTDIVAISQSTPGPIGINAATYVGYTSVINAGYPVWAAVLGSVLASLSIMWLSFILMISISHYLLTHKDAPWVKHVFAEQGKLRDTGAERSLFHSERRPVCGGLCRHTALQSQPYIGTACLRHRRFGCLLKRNGYLCTGNDNQQKSGMTINRKIV